MIYELDMPLLFVPDSKFDRPTLVKVIGLRKHGAAKLSNGWLVDDMGVAEGTNRVPGGHVEEVEST